MIAYSKVPTRMAAALIAAAEAKTARKQELGRAGERVLTNKLCGIGVRPPRPTLHLKKKPKVKAAVSAEETMHDMVSHMGQVVAAVGRAE